MEGIAALLGSENGSRYRGAVAATGTPIALLCATKPPEELYHSFFTTLPQRPRSEHQLCENLPF